MLTPEERQRIEEEERKRLAEEQYREEVRGKLNPKSPPRARMPLWKSALAWICAGLVIVVGFNVYMNSRSKVVPVSEKIVSGQIVVKSSNYVQYRIQITPEMRDARLSGKFTALGGLGNDIEVVVASEDEFLNWINGHEAKVLYSPGRKTTDHLDVRLSPGTYILAFNNRFSLLTDKTVVGEVDLDYSRAQ